MPLFRTKSQEPFQGPHQGQNLYQSGADPDNAKAAMIMIHGRGATPQSLLPLGLEIEKKEQITFFVPQAQGYTWYPFSFLAPTEQNQPGLNSGLQAVADAISKAEEMGFSRDKIFLLGFSQGACLVSEFVARHPQKYAGLFVLSGGMIGDQLHPELYDGNLEGTPVFIGCSDVDFHVPVERVHESAEILDSLNANVTKVIYPNMGHTVNEDEINHINQIVNQRL